jgi:hypothetical protein
VIEDFIQKVSAALRTAFRDAGAHHVAAMGRRAPVRSGALRRSFGFELRGTGVDISMRLFAAGLPYARVQEYGGVIKPKNRRYLTVPLPDALTPAGVLKGGARLVSLGGSKYATADGEPTFIFRSKAGNLLVATRRTHKLLYVLKSSVKLEPKLGFREELETGTLPFLKQRFAEALA